MNAERNIKVSLKDSSKYKLDETGIKSGECMNVYIHSIIFQAFYGTQRFIIGFTRTPH
jgi:hypothetical protein